MIYGIMIIDNGGNIWIRSGIRLEIQKIRRF